MAIYLLRQIIFSTQSQTRSLQDLTMSNKNWQSLALPLLYGVLVVHLFKFLCLCIFLAFVFVLYLVPNVVCISVLMAMSVICSLYFHTNNIMAIEPHSIIYKASNCSKILTHTYTIHFNRTSIWCKVRSTIYIAKQQ